MAIAGCVEEIVIRRTLVQCRQSLAREGRALTRRRAQAFGVLDVDLSKIKPDLFTGSMHKWPCGPRKGILQ